MPEESSETKIARLEEKLIASEKALSLAREITQAHSKANSALILSIITLIAAVLIAFMKR
jgi:hypothetical protein